MLLLTCGLKLPAAADLVFSAPLVRVPLAGYINIGKTSYITTIHFEYCPRVSPISNHESDRPQGHADNNAFEHNA